MLKKWRAIEDVGGSPHFQKRRVWGVEDEGPAEPLPEMEASRSPKKENPKQLNESKTPALSSLGVRSRHSAAGVLSWKAVSARCRQRDDGAWRTWQIILGFGRGRFDGNGACAPIRGAAAPSQGLVPQRRGELGRAVSPPRCRCRYYGVRMQS